MARKSMKLRFWLPVAYVVIGLCLVFMFRGAEHGWGRQAFYFLNWPSSLLLQIKPQTALFCLAAGMIQWTFIGYVCDRMRNRKR